MKRLNVKRIFLPVTLVIVLVGILLNISTIAKEFRYSFAHYEQYRTEDTDQITTEMKDTYPEVVSITYRMHPAYFYVECVTTTVSDARVEDISVLLTELLTNDEFEHSYLQDYCTEHPITASQGNAKCTVTVTNKKKTYSFSNHFTYNSVDFYSQNMQ